LTSKDEKPPSFLLKGEPSARPSLGWVRVSRAAETACERADSTVLDSQVGLGVGSPQPKVRPEGGKPRLDGRRGPKQPCRLNGRIDLPSQRAWLPEAAERTRVGAPGGASQGFSRQMAQLSADAKVTHPR